MVPNNREMDRNKKFNSFKLKTGIKNTRDESETEPSFDKQSSVNPVATGKLGKRPDSGKLPKSATGKIPKSRIPKSKISNPSIKSNLTNAQTSSKAPDFQQKRKHGAAGGVLMPRRNCNEQSRVRTVNEGFDHLREFVPCSIGTGRRAKISKVETLRSAMEYIRALEEMLGIHFDEKGEQIETSEQMMSEHRGGGIQRNMSVRDSGNNSSDGSSPPRASYGGQQIHQYQHHLHNPQVQNLPPTQDQQIQGVPLSQHSSQQYYYDPYYCPNTFYQDSWQAFH